MRAVGLRLRAESRSRGRSWAALAVLVGLGAGLTMAVAAAARRTDGAYGRFLAYARAADVLVVQGGGTDFATAAIDLEAVVRLPQIDEAFRLRAYSTVGVLPGAVQDPFVPIADRRGDLGTAIDRGKLLEGRHSDPARVDEVTASLPLAEELNLHAGDTLRLQFLSPADTPPGDLDPSGPSLRVTVVGVEALPGEFPPLARFIRDPSLRLTPAFYRRYGPDEVFVFEVLAVRLRAGADLRLFKAAVERATDGNPAAFIEPADNTVAAERAIGLQTRAIRVLAVLVGLAALLVVAQAIGRQTLLESAEHRTLRALGMTRSDLVALAATRTAIVGGGGGAIGVALAICLSPLAPVGRARSFDPDPGLSVDGTVLGLGAVVTIAVAMVVAVLATLRLSGGEIVGLQRHPSRLAALLGHSLPAPTAGIGTRLALEAGRGPRAVPVRSAVAGCALAVATVVASIGFGASLDHLLRTPSLYGVNYDAYVGDPFVVVEPGVERSLRRDPRINAFAAGTAIEVTINDRVRLQALGLEHIRGVAGGPTLVAGRQPAAGNELVLGTDTARGLGVGVGDVVSLQSRGESVRMRVVGKGVFPAIGLGSQLGSGAFVTLTGLRRLDPDAPSNYFPLRYAPRTDPRAALAELRHRFPVAGARAPDEPADVASYGDVQHLPELISGLLAVLATAAFVHTLLSSTRRHRYDLAVLKTLGLTRRQASETIAWQASTLAVLALVIALPLGIATGRWSWWLFAEDQGFVPAPITPLLAVLLVAPAALLVANLAAAFPARLAARTQPASVLCTE